MPPRGRWQPRDREWREEAAQRLEEGRSRRPAVDPRQGRPEAFGQEVASIARAIGARVRGSEVPPAPSGAQRTLASSVLLAQLEYHRKGGAGLVGGIFQPDRHSWMVEGRPVQVQLI